ncbi:hypothetical protein RSOLAG22IIIB_07615 [Rhizoctonia solani]|uniref:HAT C-terminal dimerisation domain-containing protein n=1 Tax=Rhizoctonia solani TaxID=456999 RepID=A0A0K6FNY8_9AGAM|nr:hypothetical protein RSOLAG22IIIB_07615 [Rhizoctonia solani]
MPLSQKQNTTVTLCKRRTELQGARTILGKVVALEQGANRVDPALREAYRGRFPLEPVSETPALVVYPQKPRNWGTIYDSMIRYSDFMSSLNSTAAGSDIPVPTGYHYMDKAEQRILHEFNTILEIFDDVVRVLSHEKSPPLYEVIMKLFDLKTRLGEIRDGHGHGTVLTSVTRLAAGATLCAYKLMVGNDELPGIAIVAIAMHPAYKLKWFKNQRADAGMVRETLIEHFNRDYCINEENIVDPKSAPAIDSIVDYLNDPVLPGDLIEERGGVLNYWRQELELRPHVARMALDYLTIPASSVDRVRILSGGQIPTNGLENHFELDTFRAMMSIGSWFGTPVLPDMDSVIAILEDRLKV